MRSLADFYLIEEALFLDVYKSRVCLATLSLHCHGRLLLRSESALQGKHYEIKWKVINTPGRTSDASAIKGPIALSDSTRGNQASRNRMILLITSPILSSTYEINAAITNFQIDDLEGILKGKTIEKIPLEGNDTVIIK